MTTSLYSGTLNVFFFLLLPSSLSMSNVLTAKKLTKKR